MMWSDFLDPEVQENAHRFVCGASPRELQVHVDEMPCRAELAVKALIQEQINGGGDVVLRDGCSC